ncbi:MAG: ABC transporter permease, partial [Proteobacteria bacterium]
MKRALSVFVVLLGVTVLLLPFFVQDPRFSDFSHGVGPDGEPGAPSALHWLGTDRLFRDELARLVHAGRHSLAIGVGAGMLATAIGTLVGIGSGFLEGAALDVPWPRGQVDRRLRLHPDDLVVFLLDVVQSFPFLLLVLAAAAVFQRIDDLVTVGVLAGTSWLAVARIVRAKTIQLRQLDFVHAARALGRSNVGIAAHHILPNVTGVLTASASLLASQMIVAESVLAYLGLGASPDVPSWGRMLSEGQDTMFTAPWLFVLP